MTYDENRFPYGNPSHEYAKQKGYDKQREVFEQNQDVTNHDMLLAILCSADAMWDELRRIRTMLEKNSGIVSPPSDDE